MKKLAFMGMMALCFIVVIAVGSGQAALITIDFDDISGGPGIRSWSGDRYLSDGVLFSTDGIGLYAHDEAGTNTPPTYIYGSSISSGGVADENVIVDFLTATDFVQFYLYDFETGTGSMWEAEVFDSGLNSLAVITGNTNDEVPVSFSVAGISRLVFTPSSEREGIDTLSFNAPEPATLLLLGAGLLGVGIARRRTKS